LYNPLDLKENWKELDMLQVHRDHLQQLDQNIEKINLHQEQVRVTTQEDLDGIDYLKQENGTLKEGILEQIDENTCTLGDLGLENKVHAKKHHTINLRKNKVRVQINQAEAVLRTLRVQMERNQCSSQQIKTTSKAEDSLAEFRNQQEEDLTQRVKKDLKDSKISLERNLVVI
jgi:hypothetical protein